MILLLREDWNLRQWHDYLAMEFGLHVGRDYSWAWHENTWAIEFRDPRMETLVLLGLE